MYTSYIKSKIYFIYKIYFKIFQSVNFWEAIFSLSIDEHHSKIWNTIKEIAMRSIWALHFWRVIYNMSRLSPKFSFSFYVFVWFRFVIKQVILIQIPFRTPTRQPISFPPPSIQTPILLLVSFSLDWHWEIGKGSN